MTLNNSVVIGNSDSGIYGYYARISLNNTLVTNNSGSGVRTRYGSITLNQSTVSGNSGSGVSVVMATVYSISPLWQITEAMELVVFLAT